jgi:hypothetical protein
MDGDRLIAAFQFHSSGLSILFVPGQFECVAPIVPGTRPITSLDGAYLDAEIDSQCLARCATLGAGRAPEHPTS